MEPRLSFVTLGVSNLERATHFYEHVLKLPRIETPPSISFFELGKTWLALYPREELAKDVGVFRTTTASRASLSRTTCVPKRRSTSSSPRSNPPAGRL